MYDVLKTKTNSFRTNFYNCDPLPDGGYVFNFRLDYVDKTSGLWKKEKLNAEISRSMIDKYTDLEIQKILSECLWDNEKMDGIKLQSKVCENVA